MATYGSISAWCVISILAVFASVGMSQTTTSSQTSPSPDNCTLYDATSACSVRGLEDTNYCLENGSVVTGFCNAQRIICGNRIGLRENTFCSSTSRVTPVSTIRTSFTTGSSGHSFRTHEPAYIPGENTAAHITISGYVFMLFGLMTAVHTLF